MVFEEKREQLLKEAYSLDKEGLASDNYRRRFFELVEEVVLYLLQSQDAFFGQFMLRIRRNINIKITVPIATIPERDNFYMYFNPILFLNCSKNEMAALFKHEIYHIMNSHFEREKKLKNRFSKEIINIALDISINQFIKDMPSYSNKLEAISLEHNLFLQENRSAEEYAEELYKAIKSRIKNTNIKNDEESKYELDMSKAHDLWEEIQVSEEDIRNLTKKTAISAYTEGTPEGIGKIILAYKEKAEIPWQTVLKNILPTVKSGYKKTITRRDRRQPERLDLRGRLPKTEAELIVAIDISASMNEEDMHKILIEILTITASTNNKITIIECDNEIRNIYDIKSERDIHKRAKDNGSTEFTPVFEYIRDNNLRESVLIYFTDGVGEKKLGVKPVSKKIIWVLSGSEELSLENSYGEIKRITAGEKEVVEGNIGLKMVNEVIHDWAR